MGEPMKDGDGIILAWAPVIARELADEYEATGVAGRPPIRLLRCMAFEIETLRAEAESLRAADRWIPVTERMPGPVPAELPRGHQWLRALVILAEDEPRIAESVAGSVHEAWWGGVSFNVSTCRVTVTHWRPLPAPPSEASTHPDRHPACGGLWVGGVCSRCEAVCERGRKP